MRIIYMGTPEFAVAPLDALLKAGYDIAAVITAPDKPAGRGKKMQSPPVKEYAEKHHLKVLQPEKLKNPAFIEELRLLKADLQVVVAFRMLPEIVWSMPPLGTFNLHASLLPKYRGAAPINHAIINGEKETGLTTFLIDKEIDTGKIIFREKVKIGAKETAGELHDRMMEAGAQLVVKTAGAIEAGNIRPLPQEELTGENDQLIPAPKIFTPDTIINWSLPAAKIFNLIRGLSPYPAARSKIEKPGGETTDVKIYLADCSNQAHDLVPGTVRSDGKSFLHVACGLGFIQIEEIQQAGKKKMPVRDFLRGFNGIEKSRFI